MASSPAELAGVIAITLVLSGCAIIAYAVLGDAFAAWLYKRSRGK